MDVDAGLASGDGRRAVDAYYRRPGLGGLVERSGRDHDVVNLVDSHPQCRPRVLRARGGRRGHGGRVGQAPKDESIVLTRRVTSDFPPTAMSRLVRLCRLPLASATVVRSSAPRLLPPLLSAPAYAGRCLPSSFRTVHNPPSRLPCPSCGEPLPTALQACTKCWTIFPVSHDIPYRDLFGLPYEPNPFVVDTKTLRQRFREAQTNCHPDTWASKAAVRAKQT